MKKYILLFILPSILLLILFSTTVFADNNEWLSEDSVAVEIVSFESVTTAQYTYETAGRYYNVHMKGMPAWIPVVMIIIILLFLAMFLIFSNRMKFLNEYHSSQEEKKDSKEENSDDK